MRLIDFGLALGGIAGNSGASSGACSSGVPSSDELCGTPCYMAPEVKNAGKKGKRYSGPADWFTLGVLMYELTEKQLPFGESPRFRDFKEEWVKPAFLGEDGTRDDALLDMVKGLLEWKPEKRLGGGKAANTPQALADIKAHRYWQRPEWDLVESGALPSPLAGYVEAKAHQKESEGKLRKRQRAAIETAQRMASVDKASEAKKAAAGDAAGDETNLTKLTREERALRAATRSPAVDELAAEEGLNVDGWDFVSQHAVEAEYVETLTSNVSLL